MLTLLLNQEPLPAIAEYQSVEFVAFAGDSELELQVDGVVLEPYLRPGDAHWRWRWNPSAAIGLHRLRLHTGDLVQEYQIQVSPSKIDEEQYALLAEDLWRTAHNLILLLGGGMTPAELDRRPTAPQGVLTEYYALIEGHLGDFAHVVQRIIHKPRRRLDSELRTIPIGEAAILDPSVPIEQLSPTTAVLPTELSTALGGMLPSETQLRITSETHDTYENRLLRRTLMLLLRRVRILAAAAQSVREHGYGQKRLAEAERIIDGCKTPLHQLRTLQALPWLTEVGELTAYHGPTPALQRDPNYRVILRTYLALRRAPQLTLDQALFQLPIAELPQLYEYWCTLQVVRSLIATTQGDSTQALLEDVDYEPIFRLVPGILVQSGIPGWKLVLHYQPRYQPYTTNQETLGSLDRHTRIPDIVIEAHNAQGVTRLLVLDAKYRLESVSRVSAADTPTQGVPQDALAEAYAYRAAIGKAKQSCVDWVYLLYPGTGGPERYISGVGVLPLLPGAYQPLEAILREWIAELVA